MGKKGVRGDKLENGSAAVSDVKGGSWPFLKVSGIIKMSFKFKKSKEAYESYLIHKIMKRFIEKISL